MRDRYTVRWLTTLDSATGHLRQVGWEVIDWTKFDNIGVQTFPTSEEAQARGVCKLLNSINEEEELTNVRRT